MISTAELASTARARLADAELLTASGRYDSAVYLCGYAVELQLKAAICRSLGWPDFPSSNREFEKLRAVKTHDFETLLNLTTNRAEILSAYQNEWEEVKTWNPELRYSPVGSTDERRARSLIGAATTLIRVL